MDSKYKAIAVCNGVQRVIDSTPKESYKIDVCTIYTASSPLHSYKIASYLNMAHELLHLAPSATKKQMIDIINKYK